METQTIKQRKENETKASIPGDKLEEKSEAMSGLPSRRDKKIAMAKRGLRSLAVAVSLPLCLTILNMYYFASSRTQYYITFSSPTASYFPPPLWFLHITSLASAFLMGLSAWLVWAEGGFHRKPAVLSLYLGQLVLGFVWDISVFSWGIPWLGLIVCLGMFGDMVACHRQFKRLNPIAGDLVKPCLAWTALLAAINTKLLFI